MPTHMREYWLCYAKSDNDEDTIVDGSAVLHSILFLDQGTDETITIKDGTTTLVNALSLPSNGTSWYLDIGMETSLKITLAGTAAGKILIMYDDN